MAPVAPNDGSVSMANQISEEESDESAESEQVGLGKS